MSNGDVNAALYLHQVTGDLEPAIRAAMSSGSLTDQMVSLASSCSRSLWREACAAFAAQLSDSDPVKSASCHLMVGEVAEAVDVLRKRQAFRMAVAVAK